MYEGKNIFRIIDVCASVGDNQPDFKSVVYYVRLGHE